jgi:hypothetical protein
VTPGSQPITPSRAAQHCIRWAWGAALVTFALTAANTTGAALGSNGVPFTPWMWLDVGICGVLAWGIYRRSRIAAALMFVYFTAAKALWVWNDLEMRDEPGWSDFLDSLDNCTSGGLLMAAVLVVVTHWASTARWPNTGGSAGLHHRRYFCQFKNDSY